MIFLFLKNRYGTKKNALIYPEADIIYQKNISI